MVTNWCIYLTSHFYESVKKDSFQCLALCWETLVVRAQNELKKLNKIELKE